MIVDFHEWNIFEGASEGSGRSDKQWLKDPKTNKIGLFKYTKTNKTTEHVSEELASELANLIGLKCAKIDIGLYDSRTGSMSYLINNETEILIEGIYLINKIYPNYDSNSMYDKYKQEYYSLEMIINSIQEYNITIDFLNIIIFDFLIGNTDRHQNNWAVISSNDNIKMCPMYDNGSSLCCYIEDEKIDSFLGNDKMKFDSLVNTSSRSRIRIDKNIKKEPTHIEVIKYLNLNYRNSIINLVETINNRITKNTLDKVIDIYPEELISSKRKELIKRFLLTKVKLLNNIFYGEEE